MESLKLINKPIRPTEQFKCNCLEISPGYLKSMEHLTTCPLLDLIFVDVEKQYRDMKEAQKKSKDYWNYSIS